MPFKSPRKRTVFPNSGNLEFPNLVDLFLKPLAMFRDHLE